VDRISGSFLYRLFRPTERSKNAETALPPVIVPFLGPLLASLSTQTLVVFSGLWPGFVHWWEGVP